MLYLHVTDNQTERKLLTLSFVGFFVCFILSNNVLIYSVFLTPTDPSEPAMSYYNNDPPPPYPGKHHETSFNYLPSYDSALAIEQRRRQTLEQACLTEGVSVDFSLSSETGVANNTDSQISTDASEAVPK